MELMAIILTHNESAHIEACLESVAFADSRLVFDSYSTDDTPEKARHLGAHVVQHHFSNYPDQRNSALAEAERLGAEWVLFVDADERVTPELAQEVRHVIAHESPVGWRIPRYNYLFGKLTRHAGWYPDYQTRLLKVGKTRYDPARKVHELVLLDGAEGTMQQHFIHYNYRDVAQFHYKQRHYSAYDAQILYEQGIRPKLRNYILQPLRQFWWRFVTLEGYRDGVHGFHLSCLMAWYEFRKYVLLGQTWRNKKGDSP